MPSSLRRVRLTDSTRRRLVIVLAVAAAQWGCEPVTAPELLVYADRAVVVPAASSGWKAVSVGGSHSCGLRLDGSLHCWGSNTAGQLGVGVARGRCGTQKLPCEGGPRAAATTVRFRTVQAGQRHTCALSEQGAAYCWGDNAQFQAGVPGAVTVEVPTLVAAGLQFLEVSVGTTHTCAVRTNGVVYCWGDGAYGALGRGDTVTSVVPQPIASPERFTTVRSGRLRSCAVALDASLWCWGLEWESGEGSLDFFHQRLLPHRIEGLPRVRDVSVGALSICAVSEDDAAYCWEANGFAQLGIGSTVGTSVPAPVATAERFSGVSAGLVQTCGTSTARRAFCWGNNSFGQLGVPRPGEHCGEAQLECSSRPIAVFGRQSFAQVSTGVGSHTCGITVDTSLLCWGLGGDGQLGDGFTRDRQSLPVGVLAPSP